MATSSPQACITYNSAPFLIDRLTSLEKSGVIREWYFIKHNGEWDAVKNKRDKDHIHLWLQPNKRLDLVDLRNHFKEVDPTNPRPLQPLSFNNSKLYDALLYDMHYEPYLKLKYLEREYHYTLEDFQSCDPDWLEQTFSEALASDIFKSVRLAEALLKTDVGTMAMSGQVPVNLSCQIKAFSDLVGMGRRVARDKAENEASEALQGAIKQTAKPQVLSPEQKQRLEQRIDELEEEELRMHAQIQRAKQKHKDRIIASDIAEQQQFVQLSLSDKNPFDTSDKK